MLVVFGLLNPYVLSLNYKIKIEHLKQRYFSLNCVYTSSIIAKHVLCFPPLTN